MDYRSVVLRVFISRRSCTAEGANILSVNCEEVRSKGEQEIKKAEEELIALMKEARTKDDAVVRTMTRRVNGHLVYLLGKVTEGLSSLVDQGLMQLGRARVSFYFVVVHVLFHMYF